MGRRTTRPLRRERRPRRRIVDLEVNMAASWAYLTADREDLQRALRELKGLADDGSAVKRIAVKDALLTRYDEEA